MRKSVPVMGLLVVVSWLTDQMLALVLSLLFFGILLLLPERKEGRS